MQIGCRKKEPLTQDGMDIENKKAIQVLVTAEGSDAAVKHMMQMAGGDYSRMRMLYG